MKTITLKNTFHGTEINIKSNADTPRDAWIDIQADVYGSAQPTASAKARLRRVEKALCGIDGCMCGTFRP